MDALLYLLLLGSDFDAQSAKSWKVRDAAQRRIAARPTLYCLAGFLRFKHQDAAVRQAAQRVTAAYHQWYRNVEAEVGAFPWIDMLAAPSRFHQLNSEAFPAFFGLPDRGDANAIISHYMNGVTHRGEMDNAPSWQNWRDGTRRYVADLFTAGVTREQVLAMLGRMKELEVLYLERCWKK